MVEPLTAVTLPLVGITKPPPAPALREGKLDGRPLGLSLGRSVGRVPPEPPRPPKPAVQLPSVACEIDTVVTALSDESAELDEPEESCGVVLAVMHSPTFTSDSETSTVLVIFVDELTVTAVCDELDCTWSVLPLTAAISPLVPPAP
jgi:hypothetical protein